MKIPDQSYRFPQELVVTPTSLRRVMIVGSCLVSVWPEIIKKADPGCPCDFFLFNNATQLPANPPHPIEDYDLQIVQIPLRSLLPDYTYFQLTHADMKSYGALLADAKGRLSQFLAAAMRWNSEHGLLTFVSNYLVPQQNPMGRLLPRYDLRNFVYFIEKLNEALADELSKYNNAYFFDMDQVVSTYGRRYFQDDVLWQLNHGAALSNEDFARDQERLEPVVRPQEFYPVRLHDIAVYLWMELVAMYRTVRQMDLVKLVVMDIDDTLWRGVAAEKSDLSDSVIEDAIRGWPLGLADALGYLKRRGVLLSICSRNDEKRITAIWSRIMGNHLSLEDFASRKINWRTKAENFEEILSEMNLLPRNVLFIDDNPVERESIKAAFPGVRVLGPNPYVWRRILLWSSETQVASITAESAARTDMVQAQIERESQRKQMSRDEFLASLSLELKLFELNGVGHAGFPRALELINKTNQFNTSGKRWSKQECMAAFAEGTRFYAFEVKDRFTVYGIVGVLIVQGTDIVQFVMSCRVAGLDVEIAAMAEILRILHKDRHTAVSATLVETELNLLCRDLYQRCGFSNNGGLWRRPLLPALERPAHVKIVGKSGVFRALVDAV